MTTKQFARRLTKLNFELKREDDGIEGATVVRNGVNYADIYDDGRVTTCFNGFNRLLTEDEKIALIRLVSEYACSIIEGVSCND